MIFLNDNTFKTIIIVCLIAIVAILGISAYFFINNNNQEPMANNNLSTNLAVQNASNMSNTTDRNVTTTKSTSKSTEKSKTNLISAQRAIDIVEQSAGDSSNIRFKAHLVNNGGAPYYMVDVYDDNPDSETYGEAIGGAKVDARTGVILGEMG